MSVIRRYLHNIDLVRNKLMNPLLNPLTSIERTGTTLGTTDKGYVTYDITLDVIYYWNGSSWQIVGGGSFGRGEWGSITGTLSAQTDLTSYLSSTYTPLNRNITINGVTQDLSVDRTWTIAASLPSQTGNSGKYLTTDGVNASWAVVSSGSTPSLQQVVNIGNSISNFGGIGNASMQFTNFTNGRTLLLNDNASPTIKIVDNANASNYLQIDIDTLNIDGTSYNWSSIVNPATGTLVALPFTTDHITANGNPYIIGDVVYYLGNVYRCIANNDSLLPTSPLYWTNLGAGFPLVAQPVDWNSITGNNQILNKPTIPTVTPSALTKTDDTNVTLTLGGSPSTALLAATSLTLGWAGTLADARITSASVWNAKQNAISLTTTGTGAATFISDVLNIPTPSSATFTSLTVTGDSGASTLLSGVLNVPTYSLIGLGGQPQLNGTGFVKASGTTISYDNNTYLTSAVTSVGATSPITSSGGNTPTISTSMATNKLIGRSNAGTGVMEEITVGSGLTLTGAGILNNTATPTPLGYYGAFQDVTNQFATVINVGYPMLLGVTDLSNQVTVVSGSRITIANTGIYNLQWSGQFTNPLSAEHDVTIWLRKNGVDVPGSAGVVLVPKKHGAIDGHTLPAWNYLIDPVAGDYYEFVWSTADTSVYLSFTGAGSPPPSAASLIVTVTQQSGIMAGTGVTAINSLTGSAQTIVTGTTGTNFSISSAGTTHTLNLPTASAANTGKLSSTDWDTFNNKIGSDATLLGYNGLGSPIKAYPLGINLTAAGSSLAFTDSRLWLIPVYVGANSTITGVKWYQVLQGTYTGDNYNGVGLYSISGGTLTLVASSTDDPNIWKTAASASWGSKAFSTSPTINRGTYYIGALANATGAITSSVGGVSVGATTLTGFDFTAFRMYCYIGPQLTLPASIALSGTVSLGSTALYFSLF